MSVTVIIPSRYGSTRFAGKPLAMIAGKSMIQRVYERARAAEGVDRVVVATDDARIFEAVQAFGGEAVMTAREHPSGTDRLAEAADRQDWPVGCGDQVQGGPARLLTPPGSPTWSAAAGRSSLDMATPVIGNQRP